MPRSTYARTESMYVPNPNPVDGLRQSTDPHDIAFFSQLAEAERLAALPPPAVAITHVAAAHAAVVADLEAVRAAKEAEVTNAHDRLERARAVAYANPSPGADAELQKSYNQDVAAGPLLTLATLAVEQATALAPLAEEIDKLRAAGASIDKFQTDLAPHVAAMRKHLSAFVSEVKAANTVLAAHQAAGSVVADKVTSLADQLTSIRTTADLHEKLGRRFLAVAGYDVIYAAFADAISQALGIGLLDARKLVDLLQG